MAIPDPPEFDGPVPKKDFLDATRLTRRHFNRYEAEGLLEVRYVREGHGYVVDNAFEFVRRIMAPALPTWPPSLPTLNVGLEDEYARSGGDSDLAGRILEPFRFEALAGAWSSIVSLARPSIRLMPGGHGEVGGSRIGGHPDVPDGFPWPHFFDDAPLGFVAQVSLAEVHAAFPNRLVPDRGLLSFFYDPTQEVWGFDPKDRGRWAVFYFNEPLLRTKPPENVPPEGRYLALGVRPQGQLTLPEPDSLEVERLDLDDHARKAYRALSGELEEARTAGPLHRFLGWPEQIQHDPAVEVQLPAHGIYAGSAEGYRSDEGLRLMAQRDVWQLLLQIDSDDATEMMWGDAGRMYYLITRDDLANRQWDGAWFCLQCY